MSNDILIFSSNSEFIGTLVPLLESNYSVKVNPAPSKDSGQYPYAMVIIAEGESASKFYNYYERDRILVNPTVLDESEVIENNSNLANHYDSHCWCLFNEQTLGNLKYKQAFFPNVLNVNTESTSLIQQSLLPLVKTIVDSWSFDENGLLYSHYGRVLEGIREDRVSIAVVREGVMKIASWAFEGDRVKHFVLPKSLVEIGEHAFYDCSMVSIDFDMDCNLKAVPSGCFSRCDRLKAIRLPSVTSIEGDAFAESGIEHVVINGSNYPTISKLAFDGCGTVEIVCGNQKHTINKE